MQIINQNSVKSRVHVQLYLWIFHEERSRWSFASFEITNWSMHALNMNTRCCFQFYDLCERRGIKSWAFHNLSARRISFTLRQTLLMKFQPWHLFPTRRRDWEPEIVVFTCSFTNWMLAQPLMRMRTKLEVECGMYIDFEIIPHSFSINDKQNTTRLKKFSQFKSAPSLLKARFMKKNGPGVVLVEQSRLCSRCQDSLLCRASQSAGAIDVHCAAASGHRYFHFLSFFYSI